MDNNVKQDLEHWGIDSDYLDKLNYKQQLADFKYGSKIIIYRCLYNKKMKINIDNYNVWIANNEFELGDHIGEYLYMNSINSIVLHPESYYPNQLGSYNIIFSVKIDDKWHKNAVCYSSSFVPTWFSNNIISKE